MKAKTLVLLFCLTLISSIFTGCISYSYSSSVQSGSGEMHKSFGSSNSIDTKPLKVKRASTYQFDVTAKLEEGALSLILLNENKDKELFRIEGSSIKEHKTIDLEAGNYYIRIETHEAKNGEFTIKYRSK